MLYISVRERISPEPECLSRNLTVVKGVKTSHVERRSLDEGIQFTATGRSFRRSYKNTNSSDRQRPGMLFPYI